MITLYHDYMLCVHKLDNLKLKRFSHASLLVFPGFYQPAGPLIQTLQHHDPCYMPMTMTVPHPQVKVLVHNPSSYPPPNPKLCSQVSVASQPAAVLAQTGSSRDTQQKQAQVELLTTSATASAVVSTTGKGSATCSSRRAHDEGDPKEASDDEPKVFTTLEVPVKNRKKSSVQPAITMVSSAAASVAAPVHSQEGSLKSQAGPRGSGPGEAPVSTSGGEVHLGNMTDTVIPVTGDVEESGTAVPPTATQATQTKESGSKQDAGKPSKVGCSSCHSLHCIIYRN